MSCYQCFYIKIHWCFYDGEKSYFLLYSFGYDCLFCIWGMTEKNGLCWSHASYALSWWQSTSIFCVFLLTVIVNFMFWFCFMVWVWVLCLSEWWRKKKEGCDALFSLPLALKEQIVWTDVVLIIYCWQYSYFNNRCFYWWVYTGGIPDK